MMTKALIVALCVVVTCLGITWPVAAQAKFDGSAPMLCAVTAISECTPDGKCERTTPQEENLPTFMRVDVKGGMLANDSTGRKTAIRASTVADGQLLLQGYELGKAWNMVIGTQTGRWSGAVVEDEGSYAIFGACTLP